MEELIRTHLSKIYDSRETAAAAFELIQEKLRSYAPAKRDCKWLTQKDCALITYGNTLHQDGVPGIQTLKTFLTEKVGDKITVVHILALYPYSSDDGFSVIDYRAIAQENGDWNDFQSLSENYGLMIDAIINHISQKSDWFQGFLAGKKPYTDYFIVCDENEDHSSVFRPRATPVTTKFATAQGEKLVWTTFSDDQIDLNINSTELMAELVDLVLFYASRGTRLIRLDAIGYLVKKAGTSCINLPQTHEFIKMLHTILQTYYPDTLLLTETLVPQKENLEYFGSGDEAHLIYQFALPPLVMHAFLKNDSDVLTAWAESLPDTLPNTTYFNFLGCHDGIGVGSAKAFIGQEGIDELVAATRRNGGIVSYKDNGDGTQSPYELNISYQDALCAPDCTQAERITKFLAAQTLLLSLKGMPAIYIPNLLGLGNNYAGVEESGIARRINRGQIDYEQICQELEQEGSKQAIFSGILRRLDIRANHTAFAPGAKQSVLRLDPRIFALERESEEETVLALINLSADTVCVSLDGFTGIDLFSGAQCSQSIALEPFQGTWLQKQ